MTTFIASCNTLYRLSQICRYFEPTTSDEIKQLINTIRLENFQGKSYAVATNQRIAAVEYLGATDKPDGVCHLKLSPDIVKAFKDNMLFGALATINIVPEIAFSTLTTNIGLALNDICFWPQETPMDRWRTWGIPPLKASKGSMYFNLFEIETLLISSPSGKICLPEFIDCEKPITLRDQESENWVGLFIPSTAPEEKAQVAAVLPEWWS